ncbi:SIR2 family protein [Enterococcus sp. C57]|uniref:SIR2 family protein n=1 Tax=Enterococcus sp. C57 TaxID=3231318 RepID=UPI00349FFDFC
MGEYYTDKEFSTLVSSLASAAEDFNLVVFIGAGISLSQGYPNWDGYIEKLIHFWQFNIRNYDEVKVSNQLLNSFDEILKSNNTNKRKIDLLHTLLYDLLGPKFSDVKLEFEDYFFNKVVPDFNENKILTDLIMLNPIFVTSNYDFEIERHLKRSKQKGAFNPINNIQEFRDLDNVLRSNDVLHLHGTTAGKWDFFVNSSNDYSRQYLKQTEGFNNLRLWFEKKNPVVLFLGSSMEEEEILSLLPATTKNFALMKANSNETNEFRKIYNQTYQKNNNTTIFWYGDNYKDLPDRINEIVTAVQEKLKIPERVDDWSSLHSTLTDDQLYQEILEKYVEDEHYLYDLFKIEDAELSIKLLKNTFNSKILVERVINISSFWNMLNANFEKLEKEQIDTIIEVFKKYRLNIRWDLIFNTYEKLIENDQGSLEEIWMNLAKIPELISTSFSSDPDLLGYWLLERFRQENPYDRNIFYEENTIFTIRLTKEMIPIIAESTKDEATYLYSPIKDIISDTLIKIIYRSLTNEKIFLEDNNILKDFPNALLEIRLFQRILVNISNEKNLNKRLLLKLIDKIDFKNSIFGNELNKFIENNGDIIDKLGIEILDDYKDGFGESKFGIVSEKSFIDDAQVLNEDINTVAELLLNSGNESFSASEDFFTEKTIAATSDYLISTLVQDNEISRKIKEVIITKGDLLYPKYEKLFIELIINDINDSDLKIKSQDVLLKNFQRDSFTWEEKRLFDNLIDNEKFDNSAFNILLKVKVNELNYDYMYSNQERPELIEVNDFINTELGRYLNILIKWNKNDNSRRSEIKKIVDNVESNQFKEFAQGALTTLNSPIDAGNITINTFQGYSFSAQGFKKEDLDKFTFVGKELLKKGYVNDFNKTNLFLLCLSAIDPSDKTIDINWSEINFSQILDIIIQKNIEFEYELQWIKEIILNDEDGKYGGSILDSLTNDEALLVKSEKVVEIFKEHINSYSAKVDIEILPYRIEKQQDVEKKDLAIEFFFLLLNNSKISKNYFGKDTLMKLMKLLDSDSRKKLAKSHNLNTIITPLEIEELKREVD